MGGLGLERGSLGTSIWEGCGLNLGGLGLEFGRDGASMWEGWTLNLEWLGFNVGMLELKFGTAGALLCEGGASRSVRFRFACFSLLFLAFLCFSFMFLEFPCSGQPPGLPSPAPILPQPCPPTGLPQALRPAPALWGLAPALLRPRRREVLGFRISGSCRLRV